MSGSNGNALPPPPPSDAPGVRVGPSIKSKKAAREIGLASTLLITDEHLRGVFTLVNFRPGVERLVITDQRLLAVSVVGPKAKVSLPVDVVADLQLEGQKLAVPATWKDRPVVLNVHEADVAELGDLIRTLGGADASTRLEAGATPLETLPTSGNESSSEASQSTRADRKADAKAAKAQRRQEQLQTYGNKVADAYFSRNVRIYDRGYVQISLNPFGNPPFERLMDIDFSADVTKKTGLGRGVAAVATGGVNLVSSNKRGDAYLTITTDKRSQVLHSEAPTAAEMRAGKQLAAAGRAVLDRIHRTDTDAGPASVSHGTEKTASTAAPGGTSRDIVGQLAELAALRESGALSDDEFVKAKARLLDE